MPNFKPTTPDAFGLNPDEVYKHDDSLLFRHEVEFLNTRELAEALQTEETVVRRMIDRHALPIYRISGKILFRRTEVLAYLDQKEQPRSTSSSIPLHALNRLTPRQTSSRGRAADGTDVEYLCNLIGYFREKSVEDPTVNWTLLEGATGHVLLVQRTHRDGIGIILNPTDEALARYRANAWMAWNEARVLRF